MVDIKIDGWKLNISELDLARSAFISSDRGGGQILVVKNASGNTVGWMNPALGEDNNYGFSRNNTKRKDEFFDVRSLYLLPDFDNPEMELSISTYDSPGIIDELKSLGSNEPLPKNAPTKIRKYKIVLEANSYPIGEKKKVISSEIPLSERQWQSINELYETFSKIGVTGKIYIQAEGEISEGKKDTYNHNDPLYNYNVLTSKDFTDPKFVDKAEHAACHELTHGLVRNYGSTPKQREVIKKIQGQYRKIAGATTRRTERSELPAFTILTESNYQKPLAGTKEKSRSGHPYDNYNELTASTVTVLRYFSDEFIANYKKLNPPDRSLVKETVSQIFEFLKASDADTEAIKKLLPKIENIRSTLGI